MKKKTTKNIILENILLLIPLIIYSIYKNGYLLYAKNLIKPYLILKPVYLVLISIFIKLVIDLLRYKKIKIDYELLYVILVALIMPYNINLILYTVIFTLSYILSLFLEKFVKFNAVTFMYLLIILGEFIFFGLSFLTPLESNYHFSFTILDLLTGRLTGGICSTNILFCLIAYIYLATTFHYKKDIPLGINITYLLLCLIYFLVTKDNSYFLNTEVIFGSIFIATLPKCSPYKKVWQIIISILIGILTFIFTITLNSFIGIYLAIFLTSLLNNVKIRQKAPK